MIGGPAAKIRLVRCPGCREILPELPDVPVYECGGCGKRLQAKIRQISSGSASGSAQIAELDHVSEQKESASSSPGVVLHSSGECSLDQSNGSNELSSGNCEHEQLDATNFPNDEKNDGHDRNESPDDEDEFGSSNISNGDKHESGDSNDEPLGDASVDHVDEIDRNDPNESSCFGTDQQPEICNEGDSSTHLPDIVNEELPQIAGADSESEVTDECPPLTRAKKAQVDTRHEGDIDNGRSSSEEMVDAKGTQSSNITIHGPAGESISSDILIASPNEQQELTRESAQHDRVRSADKFETTDCVNPSSELSDTLIDLSKSPITRSVRAYYDDSVSSYEGTDDPLSDRHKHSFRSAYMKRDKFLAHRNHEIGPELRNSMPFVPDTTDYAMKLSKLDEDEFLEHTRPANPIRSRRMVEADEYSYNPPFYQRGFPSGYQGGNTSGSPLNAFHGNSNHRSYDQLSYAEQEKMKLLRMVYELQDELNKTSNMSERANGRMPTGVTWMDHRNPTYYDHEEANFRNHSGFPGRFREGSNWPQRGKYSHHIPFSAEATSSIHQGEHPMCCCPQDRPCSMQLPQPGLHRINGYCKVHPGLNFHNSYSSCPSSPQWRTDSEYPMYYRGAMSDDQRHRENFAKSYLKEKHYSGRRHLRPIAGAAPFITCPRCLKQLQLPADFLLFEKRCHRIQCGSCSKLLKFSLLDRIHLVPYTSSVKAPPPSEADAYYSEAGNGRDIESTFHAHRHSSRPRENAVSFSEDYDLSLCKSASTDAEERTKRNSENAYESAGPSSGMSKGKRVSSEIEEVPKGSGGSPLHRLMGYSSPRDMIYS